EGVTERAPARPAMRADDDHVTKMPRTPLADRGHDPPEADNTASLSRTFQAAFVCGTLLFASALLRARGLRFSDIATHIAVAPLFGVYVAWLSQWMLAYLAHDPDASTRARLLRASNGTGLVLGTALGLLFAVGLPFGEIGVGTGGAVLLALLAPVWG